MQCFFPASAGVWRFLGMLSTDFVRDRERMDFVSALTVRGERLTLTPVL